MIEEKICPKCGEPYEGRLTEHLTKTCKPTEVKMEELIRLTNSRVRELETRLAESAGREQSLMLQLGERDKHLAEAGERIKEYDLSIDLNYNRFKKYEKRTEKAKSRLRAASELLKRFPTIEQAATKIAEELGIKKDYLAPDGMAEIKYYELVEVWENELEVALRGEDEQ